MFAVVFMSGFVFISMHRLTVMEPLGAVCHLSMAQLLMYQEQSCVLAPVVTVEMSLLKRIAAVMGVPVSCNNECFKPSFLIPFSL